MKTNINLLNLKSAFKFAVITSSLFLGACSSTTNKPSSSKKVENYIQHNVELSDSAKIDWPHLQKTPYIASQHGYDTSDARAALRGYDKNVRLVSLEKNSGIWQARLGAGGDEEVAINLETGAITILAKAKKYKELQARQTPEKYKDSFDSSITAGCSKSVFGLLNNDGKRDFCDSEFSKTSLDYNTTEVAAELFTSLAQAALLSKLYKVKFDSAELNKAIEESKVYIHLVNKRADEYYREFKSDYQETKIIADRSIKFVEKYGNIEQLKEHDYLVEAKRESRVIELWTINDISKLEKAIVKYEGADEDGYLERAKTRLNKLIKEKNEKAKLVRLKEQERERQIQLRREQIQLKREQEREQELLALNKWRSNLKEGDNTFCGRIIAINENFTMYQLAINAKLSGYDSEQWVHIDNLYQPWQGCVNRNGTLSPRS